jgi:putative transcriptional regulator
LKSELFSLKSLRYNEERFLSHFYSLYQKKLLMLPALQGCLLIAHPDLKDPNFSRTVVLLCQHSEKGATGVILNRELDINLEQAFSKESWLSQESRILFQGGPVALSQLFLLHNYPFSETEYEDTSSVPVLEKVIYTENPICLENEFFQPDKIKFFLGNSGWGPGQLETELLMGGWILGKGTLSLVFETPTEKIWSKALRDLGEPYSYISTWPQIPGLN